MDEHDENLIRTLARDEANKTIVTHLALCPFSKDNVSSRLRTVEIRFGTLLGFMGGSGLLGGIIGGGVMKLLTT